MEKSKAVVKKRQTKKAVKAVSVYEKGNIRPDATTDLLLKMAVDKDLDIAKLEKLVELKTKEEERFFKHEFDNHFAEMQRDFVPAVKNKIVNDRTGSPLYAYCPLETILKTYQPIINRHGFSYRWEEESIKEGKEVCVWCVVSGYGHRERTPVEIPILPGNSFTNSSQQRGSASTYGKRYSFMDAFGIIVEGEDDDARGPQLQSNTEKQKQNNVEVPQANMNDQKISPELCVKLINKLSDQKLKIEFAKKLNGIRSQYKGDKLTQKLEILIAYIRDEKKHNSASFLNELYQALSDQIEVPEQELFEDAETLPDIY